MNIHWRIVSSPSFRRLFSLFFFDIKTFVMIYSPSRTCFILLFFFLLWVWFVEEEAKEAEEEKDNVTIRCACHSCEIRVLFVFLTHSLSLSLSLSLLEKNCWDLWMFRRMKWNYWKNGEFSSFFFSYSAYSRRSRAQPGNRTDQEHSGEQNLIYDLCLPVTCIIFTMAVFPSWQPFFWH